MELVCPVCRSRLEQRDGALACDGCGAGFPVQDGIPLLVADVTAQHEAQRAYFDAEFGRYARYAVENWRASFLERIFAALEVRGSDGPYLDVGVGGSGATVIEAARLGVEAVGCDLSLEGVVRARAFALAEGVAGRASFVVCAAERLPFPDRSIACASAVAVLEHLEDDGEAVAELARVLLPGGRVWVMVPHSFRYMPPFVWPFYWAHDRRIGHRRHYDEQGLRRLFEAHGFRHRATEYSAHPVKLVQFVGSVVVPRVRLPGSAWWWRLERLDRRAAARRWGALHLSALFER